MRPEEILGRAASCELMGSTIPVVDAKDGFLLTVHHAIRENFAIESVCRDLLDTRLWLRHLCDAGRLEEGLKWAAQSRGKVAALTIATILSGYDGTAEPATLPHYYPSWPLPRSAAPPRISPNSFAISCGMVASARTCFTWFIRIPGGRYSEDWQRIGPATGEACGPWRKSSARTGRCMSEPCG